MVSEYIVWPHRPAHLFVPGAMYSLTAGTTHRRNLVDTPHKKDLVLRTLFAQGARFGWSFEAWSVMGNHYHFVAKAPEDAKSLMRLLQSVHSITAREINRLDGVSGRRVWCQYWDTCITNEPSYFARLKYVHENPAKHGVVQDAADYPWCSMRWLLEQPGDAVFAVLAAKTDRVTLHDAF